MTPPDTLSVITRETVALTVAWDEAWLLGIVFATGAVVIAQHAWGMAQDLWSWASRELLRLKAQEDAA